MSQRKDQTTTESLHPLSKGIDENSIEAILRIINNEDKKIPQTVREQIPQITEASKAIASTIESGGRIIFVGAGTSGRLGIIEATEMPPTFGVADNRFQAIIAGGRDAVFKSKEAIEDMELAGVKAVDDLDLKQNDLIIALSASGRTPFVLGTLKRAKEAGTKTVGIVCNPETIVEKLVDIAIVLDVGPEIVAGSTRMKAGTAQKLTLNMLTTSAMIKLGMVYNGYMVGVQATSNKLKERATRIVSEVAGVEKKLAEEALQKAGDDVRVAIISIKTGVSPEEAKKILGNERNNLRRALQKGERFR